MSRGINLEILEISGLGSPYSFAGKEANRPPYWHCLFPDGKMETIDSNTACKAIESKLNQLNPEIVFAGAIAFPSGAATVRWTLKHKRKCIIFDNARLQDVPRKWPVDYIKKKIYNGVDSIFCPASSWIGTFRHFGFSEHQLFYGLNAVDNLFWQSGDDYNRDSESNLPFITAGRQIAKKNFRSLLFAYSEYCKTSGKPSELILIGDGPERKMLEAIVSESKLRTVKFLPFLSQEELKAIYRKAGWFILPSYGETWGNVVNEAMASGLPVIVSNQAGCTSTLVNEGVNGFTFSPDDVKKLSVLLQKAGSMDPEKRLGMGRKSKEIISEWGLDRFCQGAFEAIQYVSEQKKRTPDLLGRLIINLWKGRYRPV